MVVKISYKGLGFLFKRNERMIDLEFDLRGYNKNFFMGSKEYRIVLCVFKDRYPFGSIF